MIDLQLGLVCAGSPQDQRLGGDRLTSRLAMCANVDDKRPLRMHTLANGKCVSTAYTPQASSLPNAFCLNSHANFCVHVCVCEMFKHFGRHDMPLASRQISIILEKYTESCNFPPPASHFPLTWMWVSSGGRGRGGCRMRE